jgi:hypothetical protein
MKLDDDQFVYDNLPTSRHTDALVAVYIFGWRWMKYKAPNMPDECARELTGIYPPKEICSIECPNGYWKIWKESSPFQELFSNWDQPAWWDLDGEYHRGMPYYSTNLTDAWAIIPVLEARESETLFKLVRKGFDTKSLLWAAEFRDCKGNQEHYYSDADTPALAICRAALLAVA